MAYFCIILAPAESSKHPTTLTCVGSLGGNGVSALLQKNTRFRPSNPRKFRNPNPEEALLRHSNSDSETINLLLLDLVIT